MTIFLRSSLVVCAALALFAGGCSSSDVATPSSDASASQASDAGDGGRRVSGTPGPKTIAFPDFVKIHNGRPIALSLEPTKAETVLTEADVDARPPIVVANVKDGSECKAGGERTDDLAALESRGLMKVRVFSIEMEAVVPEPGTVLATFARVCVGVRDGAGKWHWDFNARPANTVADFGNSTALVSADIFNPIDEPIDAVKIVIERNEVARSVQRVRYEVIAP